MKTPPKPEITRKQKAALADALEKRLKRYINKQREQKGWHTTALELEDLMDRAYRDAGI